MATLNPLWGRELRLQSNILNEQCNYTLNKFDICNQGVYYFDDRNSKVTFRNASEHFVVDNDVGFFILWNSIEPNIISILRKQMVVNFDLNTTNTIDNIKDVSRIYVVGGGSAFIGQPIQNYKIKYSREDDKYYHFEIEKNVRDELDFYFVMYGRNFTFTSDSDTTPSESTIKKNDGNYIYERRVYPDKTMYRFPSTYITLRTYNTLLFK